MASRLAATKGNLIQIQRRLELSESGHELLDRKRIILMNELMRMVDEAKSIQDELKQAYEEAYGQMEQASEENGILRVHEAALSVPIEDGLQVKVRSIMGSEVPELNFKLGEMALGYSFYDTTMAVDRARIAFRKVLDLQVRLAQIENATYSLARNIQKTRKRVNALQNITIPQLKQQEARISNELEEHEREEFIKLKVVKEILEARG